MKFQRTQRSLVTSASRSHDGKTRSWGAAPRKGSLAGWQGSIRVRLVLAWGQGSVRVRLTLAGWQGSVRVRLVVRVGWRGLNGVIRHVPASWRKRGPLVVVRWQVVARGSVVVTLGKEIGFRKLVSRTN